MDSHGVITLINSQRSSDILADPPSMNPPQYQHYHCRNGDRSVIQTNL